MQELLVPPRILPLQLLSRRHRAPFFCAQANEHVPLVEARDDAFLDLGVGANEIDHLASDVGLLRLDHDHSQMHVQLSTWICFTSAARRQRSGQQQQRAEAASTALPVLLDRRAWHRAV